MKDTNDDSILDHNIRWLKTEIEKWSPSGVHESVQRQLFYNRILRKLSGELRRRFLAEIYGVVAFGRLDEQGLKSKKRESDYRTHRRKQSEHIKRTWKKGKLLNVELPDQTEFLHYPKHRPIGSSHKGVSYVFLRGLERVVREAGLPRTYEQIRDILHNFCGIDIKAESIKQRILRRKLDIIELDEFEKPQDSLTKN